MRSATAKRTTNETDIAIQLSLTSDGETTIDTGIGFYWVIAFGKHSEIKSAFSVTVIS